MLLNFVPILLLGLASFANAFPRASKYAGRSLEGVNTNAKRFALGLPPLPPVRRATGTLSAKRSVVSPKSYSGHIKVTRSSDQTTSYISENLSSLGQYKTTNSAAHAVAVSFTASATGTTNGLSLKDTSNHRASTPYIGGIVSSSKSLSSGSSNSAVLGGTAQTQQGSAPTSSTFKTTTTGDIESAIWTYNTADQQLTAQWVNYGGSSPTTYICFNPANGGSLVLVGDVAAYISANPSAYQVTLTLV